MPRLDGSYALGLLILGFLVFFAVPRLTEWRRRRRELIGLRETWGQPLRRDREDRPIAARTPAAAPLGCDRLDDATWSDLEMTRVFGRIDRTLTSIGAQTLHRMLRCPLVEPAAIERRRELVAECCRDPELRVRLQRALLSLGDRQGWEAWFALAGKLPQLPGPLWLLRLLPPLTMMILAAGFVLAHVVLVVTGLVLALALPLVHTVASRAIGHHLQAIADVRLVLDTAAVLHSAAPPSLRGRLDDVLERLPMLRRAFGRRVSMPEPSMLGDASGSLAEYRKAFALTEFAGYQRACAAIAQHGDDYQRVLDVVGEIDAALSIAYLQAHESGWVAATIDVDAQDLRTNGLRHPLIADAVGNDVELGRLLVTGSNMAGKSTLLRTLGVNAVLAQSLGCVAADSWVAPPLRVATAMGAHDDLAAGVSLYRAEIDRIRGLIERVGGGQLFLLDEAFRGTNPGERVAASAAVLRALAVDDLVVAATHDAELCDLLQDVFVLGHFTEEVTEDDVSFDYRLRAGVLQTTNALALLERTGFPAEVVADARAIAAAQRGAALRVR